MAKIKRILKRLFYSAVICACASVISFSWCIPFEKAPKAVWVILGLGLVCTLIYILCLPIKSSCPVKRLSSMEKGCELLILFLVTTIITVPLQMMVAVHYYKLLFPWDGGESVSFLFSWSISLLSAITVESAVFWSGMLRIYTQSLQLGIKHRILGLLFAWIPGLNIYYLLKMIRIVKMECEAETDMFLIDAARAENEICKTKYPIVLVHGVFFRDFKYLNYWGRIPAELIRNGATIYYGEQQSAASTEDCGKELAERIRKIVRQSACEKVNLIAHSKGGLDCRAAISHFDAAQYVATLTTINTPHYGCIFADYLLSRAPDKLKRAISDTYNATLKKLGDPAPDFLRAVTDLTSSFCQANNLSTPDHPGVLYQSIMSYCKKARSGKFPLNFSYPLVKHFDGKNDGLVSVESAKWGEKFSLIEPTGKRGISHADMIDLNRENIPGFDVRKFYVMLVSDLKARGF